MNNPVAVNHGIQIDRDLAARVEKITKLVDLPLGGTSVWHLLEKESPQYKAAHARLTEQLVDADAALEQFATDLRTIASKFSCMITNRNLPGQAAIGPAEVKSAESLTCLLAACESVWKAKTHPTSLFSRALADSLEDQTVLHGHPYAYATLQLARKVSELATTHGQDNIADQLLLDGEIREAILIIGRYDYSTMPTFRVHNEWSQEQKLQVEQEYEDTVVRQTAQRAQKAYEQAASSSSITPTSFVSEFEKLRPNEPNKNEIAKNLGLPYQQSS